MNIIGRKDEQRILMDCLESNRPEFLVVYGRRRVGKTFLIKEFFDQRFSFYATGVNGTGMAGQLEYFNESLLEYGCTIETPPKTWREAFVRLKSLLQKNDVVRDPVSGKRIVFLDELPWMDTPRSEFKTALDYFWNSWASSQSDLMLIVCGSATSWIIGNILSDKGGFYNRITRKIHLMPFSLKECEEFCGTNGIQMDRQEIIRSYMIFGGIPYYLGLLSRRMSLAQNVDALIFDEKGALYDEFNKLFGSLFRNPKKHMAIINALAKKRCGLTRTELINETKIADGSLLTKAIKELVECGFIRKYQNFVKDSNDTYYQIIDSFTLFCLNFLEKKKASSWMKYIGTPSYNAWCGLAFEMVCLSHMLQIKQALGISGIDSSEYAWRSKESVPGAQIDMIIDRTDNVINLNEIKYTEGQYVIDNNYANNLRNKVETFLRETKTKKAVHLTFISANGLMRNSYSGVVVNTITGDDLFR